MCHGPTQRLDRTRSTFRHARHCRSIFSPTFAVNRGRLPAHDRGDHLGSAGLEQHNTRDFLKSAVASAVARGPLAGYSVQDRVDVDNSIWTVSNAVKRDTGARCSIFSFDIGANKSRLPIARNAVRKARTLHHPGVVKVIETIETDSQIHLCTERLTPLTWYTRRRSLAEETIKWGVNNVAKTVKFINDEASSVHGSLRAASVYVSDSGEWKVGNFELLSSVKEEDAVIYLYGTLVPDSGRFCPPEVAKAGWDFIKGNPVSAVDAYGFGVLLHECFNGSFSGPEAATQIKGLPPSMQQPYKRLMNPNPKIRLSVAHFLDQGRRSGGFFQTPLINLSDSLESLGLKSEQERDDFLTELNEVADQYPEDYMKRKILPELLKSVEHGGGGAKVFSVVLKIGAKLAADEYESQLTPVLVRLFASPDRAIRVCLLENLPLMVDHMSAKVVNDKVFPNMVTGFTDMAPLVREQTVKSVLTIISKLSDRTINGELLKYLAKTSNDAEPGIRTNTIICLGKIARNLGDATRSKVLIAAFTRSLKDPFVHARNAALLALSATAELFTDDDCACKVLPAICPSLMDKDKMVREQANKCLNVHLTRVRKAADSLPATDPAASGTSQATATNGAQHSRSGSRHSTPDPSSSWTGWAMSSFTSKTAPAASATDLRPETPKASGTIRPASTQPAPREAAPVISRATSTSITHIQQEAEAAAEDASGWGGFEDEPEDESDPWGTSTTASTPKNSSNPSTRPSIEDTSGEPDFAAWLAAKSGPTAAKGRPGLPKGLGPKAATGRTASAPSIASRPAPSRLSSSSIASAASTTAAKKPIVVRATASKPAAKAEEPPAEDEDWGAAWD